MRLGFYYHIPLLQSPEGIQAPAFLGIFLDSLAENVEKMTIFFHQVNDSSDLKCDYTLVHKNISAVNLGPVSPAWDRFFFPWKSIRKFRREIENCDVMIVRSPSPLAPHLYFRFRKRVKFAFLVVGDYLEGSKHIIQPFYRKIPIKILLRLNDALLTAALKGSVTFVNAHSLYKRYRHSGLKDLYEINTTTVTSNDFYFREDTCNRTDIKLLYTGRIDLSKGLVELVVATANLIKKGYKIDLYIAGWDDSPGKNAESVLKKKAELLGISDNLNFLGMKKAGYELNQVYQFADIYVMPSYHEGFPRSIWEALANSLPVIATRVGSIPFYLKEDVDAILINPKDPVEIEKNILRLISDDALRKNLIRNGREITKDKTIEVQSKKMIATLTDYITVN